MNFKTRPDQTRQTDRQVEHKQGTFYSLFFSRLDERGYSRLRQ